MGALVEEDRFLDAILRLQLPSKVVRGGEVAGLVGHLRRALEAIMEA